MRAPWHKRNPEVLVQLKLELAQKYPDLCLVLENNLVHLKGGFSIVHEGVELDRFQVDIMVPADFPDHIPVVWELGGRVPRTADWHTYISGSLCVIVPEEWLINPVAGSVMAFLDGPLRNYFIAHALAEAGSGRPMGERAHGGPGLIEAYGEMVGKKEPGVIQRYLICLAKEQVRGHLDCPCGSGKRLRNCHMQDLLALHEKIPARIAKMALKRLYEHTNGQWGVVLN